MGGDGNRLRIALGHGGLFLKLSSILIFVYGSMEHARTGSLFSSFLSRLHNLLLGVLFVCLL